MKNSHWHAFLAFGTPQSEEKWWSWKKSMWVSTALLSMAILYSAQWAKRPKSMFFEIWKSDFSLWGKHWIIQSELLYKNYNCFPCFSSWCEIFHYMGHCAPSSSFLSPRIKENSRQMNVDLYLALAKKWHCSDILVCLWLEKQNIFLRGPSIVLYYIPYLPKIE